MRGIGGAKRSGIGQRSMRGGPPYNTGMRPLTNREDQTSQNQSGMLDMNYHHTAIRDDDELAQTTQTGDIYMQISDNNAVKKDNKKWNCI